MADDCRTLLVSDDELSRALTMIQDYRSGRRDFPEEDLWRAKKSALSTAPPPAFFVLSLSLSAHSSPGNTRSPPFVCCHAVPPVKDAIVHGDTGEKIFAPFRLSAFVPMNIVICAAMLMPNPSVRTPATHLPTHHVANPGVLASRSDSPGVRC
jgi:hypothetical protein